jgi:hypothetical protein
MFLYEKLLGSIVGDMARNRVALAWKQESKGDEKLKTLRSMIPACMGFAANSSLQRIVQAKVTEQLLAFVGSREACMEQILACKRIASKDHK